MLRISDSLADILVALTAKGVSIFMYFNARYGTYDTAYATIALVFGIVWLFAWSSEPVQLVVI